MLRLLLSVTTLFLILSAFRQDSAWLDEVPDEHRFRKVALTDDLPDVVEMDIAPNGDVYFISLDGTVRVFSQERHKAGAQAVKQIAKINVMGASEARMQAIALDPNFAQNHQLYLLYAPVNRGKVNLLTRFTVVGDTLDMASAKVVLEIPDTHECCHAGGAMAFDKHGNLYITTGDNTNPFGTNYAPIDERPDRMVYDAQRTSANTNDLRGKILRIHPEPDGSYTIPKGNLFAQNATQPGEGATRPEIYIMGCRNPYRVTIDRDTDLLYWSEVGPDASDNDPRGPRGYDELNQARQAGNHGWPFFIGNNEPYAKVDFTKDSVLFSFDSKAPVNTSVNSTGLRKLPPTQRPFIWYPYDKSPEFPDFGSGGRTLIAGPIYYYDPANPSAVKFPAYFDRKMFLAEWMRNWVKVISFDDQKRLSRIEPFMPTTTFRKPMSMKFGPDGALYMVEFGALWGGNKDSRLVRIEYISGNRTPIAKVTVDSDAGAAPFQARLSARQSVDYDRNDQLTYRWRINGKPVSSSTPDLTYTFRQPGTYRVALVVTDKAGANSTAETQVNVGNAPPTVQLSLVNRGLLTGPRVAYQAVVSDREDGDLSAGRIKPEDVQVRLTYLPTNKAPMLTPQGELLPAHHRGGTWIEESDCKGCHALADKSVGPSFRAIAERYQSRKTDPELVAQLSQKILRGGNGVWGENNMSAHPQLSTDVTAEMVRYILSLAAEKPKEEPLPIRGEFGADPNRPGTYILTARYTDRGGQRAGNYQAKPITRQTTVVLRSPVLTAADFDESYELQRNDVLTDVHKDSYAVARKLDLTSVNALVFTLATPIKGTRLEARIDSPTGPLLGEMDVPPTGNWREWTERSLPIKSVAGEHDLYLIFRNRQYVLNLVEVKSVLLKQTRQP